MARQKMILPYGWRKKVAQSLTQQGLRMSSQQVADVLRGRSSNLDKYNKVVAARKKIARQHQQLLNRTGKMAAFFLISFWLI
jgi:hypothetical protein